MGQSLVLSDFGQSWASGNQANLVRAINLRSEPSTHMCCKYSFKFMSPFSRRVRSRIGPISSTTRERIRSNIQKYHSEVVFSVCYDTCCPTYVNSKGLCTLHCDGRVACETLMTQHFSTRGSGFDALSKAGHRRHHDSDTQGSDNQH